MPAKKKPAAKKAAPKKRTPTEYWVRNLRNVHVTLHTKLNGDDRRIELAPRGQRNDAVKLRKGEKDELTDVGILCEVITAAEAKQIQDKQFTNVQQKQHPALAQIRNEHGDEYSQEQIKISHEKPFEEQGEKVADLKDGNVVIDRGVGIRRSLLPGTEGHPLPNIPDSIPPEEQADWLARQKNAEGPAAGLGNLRVSVDEPHKQE